ncbi:MAG: agmatinase [Planctomycetota bacterium]|nr:MAG: agmatinase [Planctomycetota bacterium]
MKLDFLGLPEDGIKKNYPKIWFLPVPYEGTVSYAPGTRFGPKAILEASAQVELWDQETRQDLSKKVSFQTLPPLEINLASPREMMDEIYQTAKKILSTSEALLFSFGGEHSISYPLVKAHQDRYGKIGVVQIDAHADLRSEFEGTPYSHACVMRRIYELGIPILQVGIRSLSEEESGLLDETKEIQTLWADQFETSSQEEWEAALSQLPEQIYLTVDVDGFDPSILPGTGTPEPGGLSWYTTLKFLRFLAEKKTLVGVDLVELIPLPGSHASEFTAAKLVYKILNYIYHR